MMILDQQSLAIEQVISDPGIHIYRRQIYSNGKLKWLNGMVLEKQHYECSICDPLYENRTYDGGY